jgi:hypothetical protein
VFHGELPLFVKNYYYKNYYYIIHSKLNPWSSLGYIGTIIMLKCLKIINYTKTRELE